MERKSQRAFNWHGEFMYGKVSDEQWRLGNVKIDEPGFKRRYG